MNYSQKFYEALKLVYKLMNLIQFNIKLDFLSITFDKPDDIGFVRIFHENYLGITGSKQNKLARKSVCLKMILNDLINHK